MARARTWVISGAVTAVVFGAIDAVWISQVALPLYREQLGEVMSDSLDPIAAALFYVFYCAGLTYYGVAPHRIDCPLQASIAQAALYGFFTYLTWALTFKVVLGSPSWGLIISDIAWGATVCALTTLVATWLLGRGHVLPTNVSISSSDKPVSSSNNVSSARKDAS